MHSRVHFSISLILHSLVHFSINFIKRINCNECIQGSYSYCNIAYFPSILISVLWTDHFRKTELKMSILIRQRRICSHFLIYNGMNHKYKYLTEIGKRRGRAMGEEERGGGYFYTTYHYCNISDRDS